MTTNGEIMKLWGSLPKSITQDEAIVQFYRAAEAAGRQQAISAVEAELLSDSTIETALSSFGLGRKKKASTITTRAVMREALRIAKEKAEK